MTRALVSCLDCCLVMALVLAPLQITRAAQGNGLLIVNQPWARPAAAGKATEVYMDITSTAGATLVAVASDASAVASLRSPDRQRIKSPTIALPAGIVVSLAPGSYRVVLLRLNRTLRLAGRVRLTLTIEHADASRQEIAVDAEVRLHSPIEDELHAHRHAVH
jgi:copper(I)-binding protein